ncbi:hypothetical protein [Streptosporangium pseudovulgare]|uniref:Type I restriction modification DNA specificity domain-containing protein n=1 Tax=Streptosporangium pseudovulgare TaxID=35765 RepID=A0ABQ2QS25_9ACTN|nr:hypothetical protein [Streptosporangium pseudovulgare]GGP91866.1 hypothetical protein GCM10010140_22030 [Streptosporangium pseudovulgare]
MIVAPVRAKLAFADGRLDAKYHCSPGVQANEHILLLKEGGAELRPLAGEGGLGYVSPTSRTKRVYAAAGEESIPYLRPYDVFDYLPQAADLLSKAGNADFGRLMPKPGTILQTCSGRNLGPLAYADEYISRFVVSDDMLRLNIENESDRLYALTFLSTPTGQALLTRSKTGNVIDHLSAEDLGAVQVPFIDDAFTVEIVGLMRKAISVREQARIRLDELVADFQEALPPIKRSGKLRDGWTQNASALGSRLDAAYHDPLVSRTREALAAIGGVKVGEVAQTSMPNRYKRYYVESEFGRPILSGRQLLQMRPVNLQYIAARALDFSEYELGVGTLVFGARGRAEERISLPALITEERADWLASHNVMRVRPNEGTSPGWLYLCFASRHVQLQVKASAFGSVVDVVDPYNLNDVILPPLDEESGDAALQCWRDLGAANTLEAEAVNRFEAAILRKVGASI